MKENRIESTVERLEREREKQNKTISSDGWRPIKTLPSGVKHCQPSFLAEMCSSIEQIEKPQCPHSIRNSSFVILLNTLKLMIQEKIQCKATFFAFKTDRRFGGPIELELQN